MDPTKRKTLIVTGIVVLIILAIIISTIYYLVRVIRSRQTTGNNGNLFPQATVSASPIPVDFQVSPSGSPAAGSERSNTIDPNNKVYAGTGYSLQYPKGWGILTCSNSQNIEFDPYNSTDQLRVRCDYAQKPITVIVGGNPTCSGDAVKIGGIDVMKSKVNKSKWVENRWCTKTSPALDITNRVSNTASQGVGKDDFSAEIEKMIASFRVGTGS